MLVQADERREAAEVLKDQLSALPEERIPVIIAGGSFNSSRHETAVSEAGKAVIDALLDAADPERTVFVIGHRLTGYEGYLVRKNGGRFPVHAIVPTMLTKAEADRLKKSGVAVSLSIESSGLGLYKSFAYEIFKHRPSVLLAFDGNSAAANLIQEAKNGRYKSRIFVNRRSRDLLRKAQTLEGCVGDLGDLERIMKYIPKNNSPE